MYAAIVSDTKLNLSLWSKRVAGIDDIVKLEKFRECRLIARTNPKGDMRDSKYVYACEFDRFEDIRAIFEQNLDVMIQQPPHPQMTFTLFCHMTIKACEMSLPSKWEHHSGRIYELLDIANLSSNKSEFPAMAYYRNVINGHVFARPMYEFIDKMEPHVPTHH